MISAMGVVRTTTIGAEGTVTIPQELLEEAGFKPGTPLEITAYDGRIEIEPAAPGMRIEMRGRVAVLVPIEPMEGTPLFPFSESGRKRTSPNSTGWPL